MGAGVGKEQFFGSDPCQILNEPWEKGNEAGMGSGRNLLFSFRNQRLKSFQDFGLFYLL
jgi:hypothetical protein